MDASSKAVTPLKITQANMADLPVVWEIINECGIQLSSINLPYWSLHYTHEFVTHMLEEHEVYVGYNDQSPVGTVTFSMQPPHYYVSDHYLERFTRSTDVSGYVMTVAVSPKYQSQGYASQLISFAEHIAKERGGLWLRLDCREESPGLVRFYEKRGYTKVGSAPQNEGSNENYWLMEKSLSAS